MRKVSLILLFLAGCNQPHRYTCAQMIGSPPRAGNLAILPPGYKASMGIGMGIDPEGNLIPRPDFRMWDEQDRVIMPLTQ